MTIHHSVLVSLHGISFKSLILMESVMISNTTYLKNKQDIATKHVLVRKAILAQRPLKWDSKLIARKWFSTKHPYKSWNPAALDLYCVRLVLIPWPPR